MRRRGGAFLQHRRDASNRTHAKQKILNVGSILALNTKDYDLNYFLKDFEE
jgi:hypothetical protein